MQDGNARFTTVPLNPDIFSVIYKHVLFVEHFVCICKVLASIKYSNIHFIQYFETAFNVKYSGNVKGNKYAPAVLSSHCTQRTLRFTFKHSALFTR